MREVFSSWPSFTPTTGMGRRFIRLQQDGVDRAPTATASSKTLERRRWQLKQEGRRRTPWTHGRGLVRDDDPYAWCDGKRLEEGGGRGGGTIKGGRKMTWIADRSRRRRHPDDGAAQTIFLCLVRCHRSRARARLLRRGATHSAVVRRFRLPRQAPRLRDARDRNGRMASVDCRRVCAL